MGPSDTVGSDVFLRHGCLQFWGLSGGRPFKIICGGRVFVCVVLWCRTLCLRASLPRWFVTVSRSVRDHCRLLLHAFLSATNLLLGSGLSPISVSGRHHEGRQPWWQMLRRGWQMLFLVANLVAGICGHRQRLLVTHPDGGFWWISRVKAVDGATNLFYEHV